MELKLELDQLRDCIVVTYTRNGLGEISTFSLPQSQASGSWGKSAACQSGAPKEKRLKSAKGVAELTTNAPITISSKWREAPGDDQDPANSSHPNTRCRSTHISRLKQPDNNNGQQLYNN